MAEQAGTQQNILDTAFDAAPVAMVLLDKNLLIQRANLLAEKLLGKNSSQITNRTLGDCLQCSHSPDDDTGCADMARCVHSVASVRPLKVYSIRANLYMVPKCNLIYSSKENRSVHVWKSQLPQ